MNNYCTLFDSNYLARALAMYRSLTNTGENFMLYVFCFDDIAYDLLFRIKLANVTLIKLRDFETEDLLNVKKDRTTAEYCWTCTPFVIRYSLDKFGLDEVTYIDADLYFFKRPEILLKEFHETKKSVLITEHRYTPKYDKSDTAGIYCVQFITFKSDINGIKVLQWWQDRCLEWCYNRVEDGKLGDQKYLDSWTYQFEGVHVLNHLGGGVAPWNVQQYKIGAEPSVNGIPIVFYHFHALRWYANGVFDLSLYLLSKDIKRYIYSKYIRALNEELLAVKRIDSNFSRGMEPYDTSLKKWVGNLRRLIKGNYNVLKFKKGTKNE